MSIKYHIQGGSELYVNNVKEGQGDSKISSFCVGIWVRKCSVEAVDGAVECNEWMLFVGLNHHIPHRFQFC